MDFEDTPQEAEFRAEARDWLNSAAEKRRPGQAYKYGRSDPEFITVGKEWEAKKFEGGFSGITVPKEYGGRGGTKMEQVIYSQEEDNYLVPRGAFGISHGMAVPTLMTYATEEVKKRYIPATLKGDEVWCQLFSEPVAGSDLAGLKTRAERDGDDWVINGQKIWTSGGHYADYAILVTRSDPTVEKHKGLTYFFVNMKTPGIDPRPIKQIPGGAHFNETFLTDVRIPDSQRLGDEGEGWQVAITTLMNERLTAGDQPEPSFEEIFTFARNCMLEDGAAIEDPAVREKLADWYIKTRGLELNRFRAISALSRGDRPGPENSISKLVWAFKRQMISHFAMDLMDMGGVENSTATMPQENIFLKGLLDAPGARIAAGTDEILRNIIAERVLRMPQDVRTDKKVPYNQIGNA